MKTLPTQIAFVSCAAFLMCAPSSKVQADKPVEKLLNTQQEVGVSFSIKRVNPGTASAYQYLYVSSVFSGSPAERAGLQRGDGIFRVRTKARTTVVDDAAKFDAAIAATPGMKLIELQVRDRNTGNWQWVVLRMQGVGVPMGPGPGSAPPASPKLAGIWMSSGGGTVHFRGSNPIVAESNVPWVGRSDLEISPNGDGTYNFVYQQRGGLRDSGHGKLTPRDARTIDGYLINGLGMRFDFVLTR
ncbi:MAG: hypothetical protein P8N76_09170 [Pirellulaceae bacterium]|nr:hypothetical protein [Pirellulaceae bacterium]